jgi:hypothetical protein
LHWLAQGLQKNAVAAGRYDTVLEEMAYMSQNSRYDRLMNELGNM